MNFLSGKWVEYTEEYRDGSTKIIRGTLVDFYASARDGVYALVLIDGGKLKQVGVWDITVLLD